MADELTINAQLRVNSVSGGLPPLAHQKVATIDQTNKQKVSVTLALTTSTSAIDVSSLTGVGYCWFENIGTTNNAIVMIGTNEAFIVSAGVGKVVQLSTNTTYTAKAAASTTSLVIEAYGI